MSVILTRERSLHVGQVNTIVKRFWSICARVWQQRRLTFNKKQKFENVL